MDASTLAMPTTVDDRIPKAFVWNLTQNASRYDGKLTGKDIID
eukprot:CAMPEP_0196602020 /NCGR_PEP_ID=MMETSP1081-20130531/96211_1 /TAXON_ID=36882 /ORGANISM="Pyramimonas amylifera, Strain CCMP720" /LENGTH=42 /DNA_ID= /DNA_START= /DNA_END= /DNA_ORIENTATION=